jgi:hypothetical protein
MTEQQEFDNPWKAAIHTHLRSFLAICFPLIEQDIDWSRSCEFLDTELLQTSHRARTARRNADVIVKVTRLDTSQAYIVIHIEVQAQRDPQFSRRMWTYHYRIVDFHDLPVVSLAVLADRSPHWRPAFFQSELWGCRARLDFPTVKLLDLEPTLDKLLAANEPFAFVLAAHLNALRCKSDSRERLERKRQLIATLYEKKWLRDQVVELFNLIDWLMKLTPPLTIEFNTQLHEIEEDRNMRYINSIERLALSQGREQGQSEQRRASIHTVLFARFREVPDSLSTRIAQAHPANLDGLLQQAATCLSLADFSRQLAE